MARKEPARKTHRDRDAADLIRRMRTNEGLSQADFARAVTEKGVEQGHDRARVFVSEDTIYLIERFGHEPGPRIKFAIALYFDLRPGQVWKRDALGRLTAGVAA